MFTFIRRLVLFLVGFALPIEYLSVDLGIIITPIKVSTALMIGAVVLRLAFEGRSLPRDRLLPWISLLLLSVAISAVWGWSEEIPLANVATLSLTWVSVIILYVALNYLIDDARDLDTVVVALAIGGVFVAVSAALGLGFQVESSEGARQGGYGGNVNQLGANLSIAFPLTVMWMLQSKDSLIRGSAFLFLSIHLAGIVGTLSRSTYLAVAVMFVFWLVRFARKGTGVRLLIPGLVLIIGVAFLAPASFYERLLTVAPDQQSQDHSVQVRLRNQLPDAISMFSSNPLIGVGMLRSPGWSIEFGTRYGNVIHNSYLQIAAEHGLLGLVPFSAISLLAWLQISMVIRSARMRNASEAVRSLGTRAVFVQIALLGVFVNSMTHATLRDKGPWLIFAFTTILVRLMRRETAATSRIAAPASSGATAMDALPARP